MSAAFAQPVRYRSLLLKLPLDGGGPMTEKEWRAMTEDEYLAAKEVLDLGLYQSAKGRFRKWRLFGVACCRRALERVPVPRLEPLATAAEQFADGVLAWDDMKKLRRVLAVKEELGEEFGPDEAKHCLIAALDRATGKLPLTALGADEQARYAIAALSRPKWDEGMEREEEEQVKVAHDIFGNPFRPVVFDPVWSTDTAVSLARRVYESRDFSAMPILADALQDAGCENTDVLRHCRGPGSHVKGCWIVDALLGKN
jgi:hypothetical protein